MTKAGTERVMTESDLTIDTPGIYNVDTMASRIARWGNSLAIRIPKAALDSIDLGEGDPVAITTRGRSLVLERAHKVDLEAMIEAITPETRPDRSFDVAPVGRELI
jgi:antitoxin MazE